MSRTNWRSSKKQIDEWCATRIIPYKIEKDGIVSLLLGLDKKFKEFTPFGGACTNSKGSCARKDTTSLKNCLARELSEESKELIDLNTTVDFVNCKYIHYVLNLTWGSDRVDMHNNIYFSQWVGDDKETIIKYFNDVERDKKLENRLRSEGKKDKVIKSYFEMDTIAFIPITYEVFGEYIYNSIQDFYKLEETYRKEPAFYNQVSDIFSALFKRYPRKNNGDTNGRRLDPRFLMGLIEAISDYFDNEYKYRYINDIVDDVIRYIKGIQKGCSINIQTGTTGITDEDDTPLGSN